MKTQLVFILLIVFNSCITKHLSKHVKPSTTNLKLKMRKASKSKRFEPTDSKHSTDLLKWRNTILSLRFRELSKIWPAIKLFFISILDPTCGGRLSVDSKCNSERYVKVL